MFQSFISLVLAGLVEARSTSIQEQAVHFDDRVLLSVETLPEEQEENSEPGYMSARAVLGIDLESKAILFEKNSYTPLPIASLTKLMTAYIIINERDPESNVVVSANAAQTGGSRMGLYAGEEISVKNLIQGLLIESGNDAAVALAEFHSGSEAEFVKHMNEVAKKLGLLTMHFVDSSGLQINRSSAKDLGLLSAQLAQYQSIREITQMKVSTVSSANGTEHRLNNTNLLLGQMGIFGLKTGKTPEAGECFVSTVTHEDGREILTVVLGSNNRFADTKVFLDWIYNNFKW